MGRHCSWREWGCLKSGDVSPLHGYCESAYHQVQRAAVYCVSQSGEQLQVKQKWHYFRTRISVPEIWINTLQTKSIFQLRIVKERERELDKNGALFFKNNSTLIFFLFKLKAQYSQINNPFLDPKPEGKIHFWYSE